MSDYPYAELLIDYLDGELSQEERRSLEERLAQDPALRLELKMLEQSWESLDLLEREPTDGTLVETTLHSVVLQTEESLNKQKSQRIRRNVFRFLAWTAVLAVLFVVSFVAGERLVPQDRFLARAVAPIIERLDMYLAILDEPADFLPMLTQQCVFLPKNQVPAALSEYLPSKSASFSDAFSLFPS
jgi:anti-sigma factor RsiW